MRNCPNCDAEVKSDQKFCGRCGTPLQVSSRYTGDTTPVSIPTMPVPEAPASRPTSGMAETSLHKTAPASQECYVPEVAQREVEVLVIDCSASTKDPGLHGTKLHDIKGACRKHVLQKMHVDRQDYIALVSFSERAKTECDWSKLREPSRLITAIKGLSAGGNTRFGAGLEQAERLLDRLPIEDEEAITKKILFLTDGHNNRGNPLQAARRLRSAGVVVQAVGFESSKEKVGLATLEDMVSVIDGQKQYWFCSNIKQLTETFTALSGKTAKRF